MLLSSMQVKIMLLFKSLGFLMFLKEVSSAPQDQDLLFD